MNSAPRTLAQQCSDHADYLQGKYGGSKNIKLLRDAAAALEAMDEALRAASITLRFEAQLYCDGKEEEPHATTLFDLAEKCEAALALGREVNS